MFRVMASHTATKESLSSPPDPSLRAAGQSMSSPEQPTQGDTFPAGRKRVARACDRCSKSRTRCNGTLPWLARVYQDCLVTNASLANNLICHIPSQSCTSKLRREPESVNLG